MNFFYAVWYHDPQFVILVAVLAFASICVFSWFVKLAGRWF